jgi:nitroreductase
MDDEYLDMEKYRLGKLKEELYDIDPNVLDIICAREHGAFSAAEMMALAACERGISSCIERYFDVYKASRILRVPNSHLVTYLIALGYSNELSGEMSSNIESAPIFYNIFDK